MDTTLHDLLALVETLVPICILLRPLKPRLWHNRHDLGILQLDLLDESRLSPTLNIRIIPALHLPHVLILRVRHPNINKSAVSYIDR